MNRFGWKRIAVLMVIVFVAAAGVGVTNAWFYEEDAVQGLSVPMGRVALTMENQTFELVPGADSQHTLTIGSNGTIPFYLRMGYTLLCEDEQGNAQQISIPSDLVSLSIEPVNAHGMAIVPKSVQYEQDGLAKDFLVFADGEGKLTALSLAGGEAVDAVLHVRWNRDAMPEEDLYQGATWRLYLMPEAVQATDQAVQSLADFGW